MATFGWSLGLGNVPVAQLGPLGVLIRQRACLGGEKLLQTIVCHDDAQDHEEYRKDELQPLGRQHLKSGASGERNHTAPCAHCERREGAGKQKRHWHIEHEALTTGRLTEDGERDHGHATQKLVGRAKEWPDIEVPAKGKRTAYDQSENGREPGVGDNPHCARTPGLRRGGVTGLEEELLK